MSKNFKSIRRSVIAKAVMKVLVEHKIEWQEKNFKKHRALAFCVNGRSHTFPIANSGDKRAMLNAMSEVRRIIKTKEAA